MNTVNARGQFTGTLMANRKINVTNTYDDFGFIKQAKHDKMGGSPVNILTFNTTFDAKTGNLDNRSNSMFNKTESFTYDELDRLTFFTNAQGFQEEQKYDDKGKIRENSLGTYNYTNTAKTYQNTSIDLRTSAVASYENKQCIFYDDMEIGDGFIAEQPTTANYYLPIRYSNSLTPKSGGKSIRLLKKETSVNSIQSGKWLAINNTKDTEYTYSGWIYCYSSNAAQIQLLMKTANETANFTLTDKMINPSASNLMSGDGWVYLEKKILVPANIKQLSIRLENIGSLDSSVWFDDVCIRKTENITPLRELNITYNAFKSPVQIEETGVDKISFLYNDANNRSSMFYGGLQDDKLLRPLQKHYSIDGSTEIKYNTQTSEVEFITYIGGDGYTAPVVLKSNGTTQDYLYLHRDYQGTILAISNALGAVVEKRLFDAWGLLLKVEDGKGNVLTKMMVLDRGYTGHEHIQSVGLVHMNGRLYDAKLHRFLQPDNFVQDPYNTQNFNRYGYVLNNPLKYIDPSGEFTWSDLFAVAAIVVGVAAIIISGGTLTPLAQWCIGAGVAHFLGSFAMYANNGYKDWDNSSNYIGMQSPTVNIDMSSWFNNSKNGIGEQDSNSINNPKPNTIGGSGGNNEENSNENGDYDSWFFENQYFSGQSGLRAGTYIDFSPIKKFLGITIGEYRESSITGDYYDSKGNITKSSQNHYFEVGASMAAGFDYKYNLGEHRFESFSLSLFGFSAEYSKQSSYQRQFYLGLDTGFSIGIGVGGDVNIKGGWRWDW